MSVKNQSAAKVLVPKYVFKRMAMLPINLPKILAELAIEPTALLSDETALPLTQYADLWRRVAEICQDPAVGLKIASFVTPEHFGVVSYSMITSKTLAQGIALLAKYNRVRGMCDFVEHVDEKQAIIGFDWPIENLPNYHCESALVYLVSLFRWVTNSELKPITVHFRFKRPKYSQMLQQFFGCQVLFEQSKEMMVLDITDYHQPIVWHDSELNKVFVGSASRKLLAKTDEVPFCERVREVLRDMLSFGKPVAKDVAKALNVSLRTFHRKLKVEQTSFQCLLDEVRKEQTMILMQAKGVELKEIAYRLGYANPSAFYRAFHRWTGKTPKAYRALRH